MFFRHLGCWELVTGPPGSVRLCSPGIDEWCAVQNRKGVIADSGKPEGLKFSSEQLWFLVS